MKKHLLSIACLLTFSAFTQAQTPYTDFDKVNGANTYAGGLNDNNWVNPTVVGLTANAGSDVFASANGNSSGSFPGLGIEKTLGGTIENKTYNVSFYIATYGSGTGVLITDFTTLYIGGSGGTTTWTLTPTPTGSTWVKWSGTYTPSVGDVGQPFVFKATFNLAAGRAIVLDGTIGIEAIQAFSGDFDKATGTNTYAGGLSDGNWTDGTGLGFTAHAGTEVLASANGNISGGTVFNGLGIEKNLGGTIENKIYDVSFYIATYGGAFGVPFSDFTTLYIGGSAGTMTWTYTPVASTGTNVQWTQWRGTYTPNAAEIGEPFVFKAVFNLQPSSAIAIDGTIGIVEHTTTATTNAAANAAVSVYPNPFNDRLTIDLDKNTTYSKIEIFNAAGEIVQVIDQPLATANWNGLCANGTVAANGLYTLRIQNENATVIKRVVLNRTN
ncbi:T9SS type A sorting domain-containing protein [Cytophaga aurantiaca]|uniref:T9SS type A sorting domain-containing protein n=1 Tax=Cytophaga aurantiaca TaxID=29530 RepID=UPI000369A9A9|nr:T9SS type A sorting domain-containing protein [Cytophaga aurantiaca]